MVMMKPQETIVRLIVAKHIEVLEISRLSASIGVQIGILDKLHLLDLAMDVIGYPPTNIFKFDTDIVYNNTSTQPDKRQDFENMFDRIEYRENEWNLEMRDVDAFVDKLYSDFDGLLLARPHLFIKTEE